MPGAPSSVLAPRFLCCKRVLTQRLLFFLWALQFALRGIWVEPNAYEALRSWIWHTFLRTCEEYAYAILRDLFCTAMEQANNEMVEKGLARLAHLHGTYI